MTFALRSVVPWGRSFEEYVSMFMLTDRDLSLRILGCGDGPAAFNSRMRSRGCYMVSVDPLYRYSRDQIEARIHEARSEVMEQMRKNPGNFVWERIRSPEELERIRMAAMSEFLDDFERGRLEGRYLPCSLPDLPFRTGQFGLALCSHFLFLYPESGGAFHLAAIREMIRVAQEVRIYPTVSVNCTPPLFLEDLLMKLGSDGLTVDLVDVDHEAARNFRRRVIPDDGHGDINCSQVPHGPHHRHTEQSRLRNRTPDAGRPVQ